MDGRIIGNQQHKPLMGMFNKELELSIAAVFDEEVGMRALSIRQPHLYCITHLGKDVENRTWKPPLHIIGKRIALHASGKLDGRDGFDMASSIAGFDLKTAVSDMPLGAIVATAVVAGWFKTDDVRDRVSVTVGHGIFPASVYASKWYLGDIGWALQDVIVLPEPIPCKGALSLWKVPSSAMPEIIHSIAVGDNSICITN